MFIVKQAAGYENTLSTEFDICNYEYPKKKPLQYDKRQKTQAKQHL